MSDASTLPIDQRILAAAMAYGDAREKRSGIGTAMNRLRVLTELVREKP